MPNRDRYSRLALAGGVLALIGVADYVVVALTGFRAGFDAAHLYRWLGIPIELAEGTVLLSILAGGPACLMFGKLAQREIRLHPGLRGELLAQLTVIAGWLGILGTIVAVALVSTVLYLRLDAG